MKVFNGSEVADEPDFIASSCMGRFVISKRLRLWSDWQPSS